MGPGILRRAEQHSRDQAEPGREAEVQFPAGSGAAGSEGSAQRAAQPPGHRGMSGSQAAGGVSDLYSVSCNNSTTNIH